MSIDYLALNDQQLLQSIGQRDQAALAELYRRYGMAVYSVAMRVLDNASYAEEVAALRALPERVQQRISHINTLDFLQLKIGAGEG